MSATIEELITPQYVYSNILEHLRSHLNVKTLNSSELSNLSIVEVEIAAFGTRYHFNVERTYTDEVESSSMLLLPSKTAKKVETKKTVYFGFLEETLEPGATRPTFEFQIRATDSRSE